MPEITAFLEHVKSVTDAALDSILPPETEPPTRLHKAIRWSVFAGGKRVRPAIVLAAGRAFGAPDDALVSTAAAIELIHTYSLVHDDLPSMDDDDLRRGRPTCHKQFGEATAILAGDVMQTLAFRTLASDESVSPATRLKLISTIAEAAGTPRGMVSGQQLDLDAEGSTAIELGDLENIHSQKTGAMIVASATAGGIIGGAGESELQAIAEYAASLGLLFQVTDDILDVTGLTETLGKTAGKDEAARKATYPAMLGMEDAVLRADELRSRALNALSSVDRDTALLRQIVEMVATRMS